MNQLSNTSKLDHLPKTTWNSKANRYHTIHTEHLHLRSLDVHFNFPYVWRHQLGNGRVGHI